MASPIKKDLYQIKSSTIWLLLFTASSVTLYFNPGIQDPFNTPKLIIILLSSSWMLGHLLLNYKKSYLKLKSKDFIVSLIILFLLSMLIAFYFSDNKLTALIGDNMRRNGLLLYLALAVILLFASRTINFIYSLRLIQVAVITGLVSSSYGIVQMTGNDPVSWNNPYNPIIVTLGNPNFAAAAMAIFSLISIFSLFLNDISKIFKFISLLTFIISLVAIYNSQSRQGLLTLLFGIIFYLSVYAYLNLPKTRSLVVLGSSAISIFLIIGMLQI